MQNVGNNNIKASAVAFCFAGGICSAPSWAQSVPGYLTDSGGNVVKSQSSLCVRTGSWTPAAAIAACDPDLVAKPAPKPVPIKPESRPVPPVVPAKPEAARPEAAKPAPRAAAAPRVCDATVELTSDQLFAFGKATLNTAAKARLDKDVIGRLASCDRIESIAIEGHTDRLGSAQANQRLSMQRAEAVNAYLRSKRVPVKAITTSGKGAAVPAKTCPDTGLRSRLIACLAPNRRVVIQIKGVAK